ncbi:membrane protein, partial [Ralstonia pseudosolanacearum]
SADAAWNTGAIEALRDSITAQGEKTGVRWADALSTTVRSVVTYLFVLMYTGVKLSTFGGSAQAGVGFGPALLAAWSEADQALLAGILNFWFISRVWERRGGQA